MVLDVPEGKAPLVLVLIQMDHSQLAGVPAGDGVHHIVAEVKYLSIVEGDSLQAAVFILLGIHELFAHQGSGGLGGNHALANFSFLGLFAGENHGYEHAVRPVNGDHAVGGRGVVVDAVALAEDFGMLADLHLQLAADHQVELLAGVGSKLDGLVLLGGIVLIANPVGLSDLVPELGSQVGDVDAVLLGGLLAAALTGNGVAGQPGAAALQQLHHFYIKGQGALMNEAKRNVNAAAFVNSVGFLSNIGLFCHFRFAPAHNRAHLLDTGSDFRKL